MTLSGSKLEIEKGGFARCHTAAGIATGRSLRPKAIGVWSEQPRL